MSDERIQIGDMQSIMVQTAKLVAPGQGTGPTAICNAVSGVSSSQFNLTLNTLIGRGLLEFSDGLIYITSDGYEWLGENIPTDED